MSQKLPGGCAIYSLVNSLDQSLQILWKQSLISCESKKQTWQLNYSAWQADYHSINQSFIAQFT